MKTEWDYTSLAKAYLKRPEYSATALDKAFGTAGFKKGSHICDVGAGVAHLTIPMLERGFTVDAVEPNDEMRRYGVERTNQSPSVKWFEGTGEDTTRPSATYEGVTFGSSFNVMDRSKALLEVKRIAKPSGWFVCMWNHRDLEDPLQAKVEQVISNAVDNYNYGTRREDQSDVIKNSGLFNEVISIQGPVTHKISVEDYVEAWRSHATLHRQAGERFKDLIVKIEDVCRQNVKNGVLNVPYTTRLWMAQLRS